MQVYLNGKLVAKEEAKVSVFDHGVLYGDGVFEGLRAYNGRIFRLEKHIDRLIDSAKAIMLNIPISKKELIDAVVETVRANNIHDGYVRLVVTRGTGDLGLDPRKCPVASTFIIADKITLYPEELYRNGMEIITVPTRRNIPEALNPCIKSLNYLNNIMAKIEAIHGGVHEALMLNSEGYVTECTGDNIFIVRDNILLTPPTWVGALKGITRDVVMELAKENKIEIKEEVLTRYDLYTADECLLTGTAAEIIPIIKIDSRIIGTGKPGNITLKIMQQFRKLTQTEGVEVYKS
ncbi:branched-chain-amino-acid transaminase [Candidatus Desantisbacteria bacterium]|nr:branched-chain-amino-acid transaminase [Candidatus Desantisbacteria bacterium]